MIKQNTFLLLLFIIILALDFTIFNTIRINNKPDLIVEYLILIISSPTLGYIFGSLVGVAAFKLQRRLVSNTPFKNYHIHHSLVAILIIILGFAINLWWLKITLIGFGVGLFIHHTVNEGLIFITTYNK